MIASLTIGSILYATTIAILHPSGLDILPLTAIFIAQLLHAPCSIGYHTFMCMYPQIANLWRRLDLSFVLVLNTLTTFAMSYYTWTHTGTLIACCVSIILTFIGIYNISRLKEGQPVDRVKIVSLIGISALGYYIPVIYRAINAIIHGRYWVEIAAAISMVICHSIGGLCYSMHWPQRQFTYKFDLVGHSHNIMNITSVLRMMGCPDGLV